MAQEQPTIPHFDDQHLQVPDRLTFPNIEPQKEFPGGTGSVLPVVRSTPTTRMKKISNELDSSLGLTSSRSFGRCACASDTVRTKWLRADDPALERMRRQSII
jgi:hypothetical protein